MQTFERLDIIQEMAKIGVWEWHILDNRVQWSSEVYRQMGYTPGEVEPSYDRYISAIHPDDRQYVETTVADSLAFKKDVDLNYRVLTPAGELRYIRSKAKSYYDEQGRATLMEGYVQEVPESRNMTQLVSLNSAIIDNMAEGINLVNSGGEILCVNSRFEKIFGYETGELIGKHASILNAPSSEKTAQETANMILNTLDEVGVWSGEVHSVKKDGTEFWTYANISSFNHMDYGQVWLTVQQDITQRKKIEQEALESDKTTRALLDAVQEVLVLLEADTYNVLAANKAICDSLGTNEEEIIGRCIPEALCRRL